MFEVQIADVDRELVTEALDAAAVGNKYKAGLSAGTERADGYDRARRLERYARATREADKKPRQARL